MNTVTIGQQHYRWDISIHTWLHAIECTIYNIIDPAQKLVIIKEGTDTKICTPQNLKLWINFALNQGWYRETRVYKLFEINNSLRIGLMKHSLAEEAAITQVLADRLGKSTTALEKSEIKSQFVDLEKTIELVLPTIFKQLYLTLGNGDFGPDYGFFTLFENPNIDKITIEQAYQKVHHANIKDWDWELPKLLVPFLYWGSDIYSLIDCSSPYGAIYVLDKNLKKENATWQSCVWEHCPSMMDWLQKWSQSDTSGRSLWLEMYQLKGLI